MPKKAKGKKGGKPIRQPKQPVQSPSSSEGEDEEMVVIQGLIGRMEALEKARAVPSDEGGGPSGLPGRVPKRTQGVTRAQLLRSISDRLGALRNGGLPGPGLPASPDVPVVPVPMSPSPSPVVPDAPVPADPIPLEPAEPVVLDWPSRYFCNIPMGLQRSAGTKVLPRFPRHQHSTQQMLFACTIIILMLWWVDTVSG
ncbi:uncharacterized protein LOC128327910 isoform X2 [Hemicordylus capensis]|uniref:uncharacterized protein LOC128327910 isoform X2 n=1 Tax=Hemicordylus capensis TaxID=884348 RepID=UPI0023045CF9|nr:uncharacterized protein LOC128327910 isoform X2 [Hemicordylus capensis]